MESDPDQRIPLSRERWLELAMDTLSGKGHSKFSLDALIKAMPVSKGSFYWHFRNRAEFLMALVEFWDRHETQNVVAALANLPEDVSAEDKLWELMCVVYETQSIRHELLIRALTMEFPEVKKAVETVDRTRAQTVKGLFAQMGFEGDELEMRTLAFTAITSMDRVIHFEQTKAQYERQLELRHAWFTGKTAKEAGSNLAYLSGEYQ
jgi:AcrR family transcriptional regulator